jgi:hypothetical protein
MAPWDVWGAQPRPQGEFDLAYFDGLAALTSDPDSAFADVRHRYQKDDGLRVPTTVYNALNERHEAIDALLAPLGKPLGASPRHADVHIVS